MKLQHLKYTACPVCGKRVVSDRQRAQHCNGEWFEEQWFECGCVIKYVPNFSREEVQIQCPEHPTEKARELKHIEAKRKALRYISRLDVDDVYKAHLTRYW
jgi:hypothetical protein